MDAGSPLGDREVDERMKQRLRYLADDETSTASSAADLPSYGHPASFADFEATASDQLGDAFDGDLTYVDERRDRVRVAVFRSSSSSASSSLSSESEHRRNDGGELRQPAADRHRSTSRELSAEVREPTSEAAETTAANAVMSSSGRTRRNLMTDEHTQTSSLSASPVLQRTWSASHAAVLQDYIDSSREACVNTSRTNFAAFL